MTLERCANGEAEPLWLSCLSRLKSDAADLAAAIEAARKFESCKASFALLAERAMRDAGLGSPGTTQGLLEDLFDPLNKDRMHSWDFSDLTVTLVSTPTFRIDFLVWSRNSTAIHDHGFSGAFTIIDGESLAAGYEFAATERSMVSPDLGLLRLRDLRVLRPGTVMRIDHGSRFIHANLHLSRPTCTMVARAHDATTRQYSYFYPGLRCSAESELVQKRRSKALRILYDHDPIAAHRVGLRACQTDAPNETFALLSALQSQDFAPDFISSCIKAVADRPDGIDVIAAVAAQHRLHTLDGYRRCMKARESRLALLVLMAIDTNDDFYGVLRSHGIDISGEVVNDVIQTVVGDGLTDGSALVPAQNKAGWLSLKGNFAWPNRRGEDVYVE